MIELAGDVIKIKRRNNKVFTRKDIFQPILFKKKKKKKKEAYLKDC